MKISIIGSGTMGTGIAQVLIQSEEVIKLKERANTLFANNAWDASFGDQVFSALITGTTKYKTAGMLSRVSVWNGSLSHAYWQALDHWWNEIEQGCV